MSQAPISQTARADRSPPASIEFNDLAAQRRRIGPRMEEAILRVVRHGRYIMGPEVAELEKRLAAFCGAKHAISCANGTDALALVLMARGIRPGDAVFVPAFTFVATAEVVAWLGATPVFVDVEKDSFNLDPASLERGIGDAVRLGLKPRAVIPVDLFGQPADYRRIVPLAERHGLFVLSDAAQSFGAALDNRRVGTFGGATATSFFPAKPLGCYGDGGAIFTDDDALADVIRSLRIHGQGTDKYDNVRVGVNGRLDTMQAAVLIEKLSIFEAEIAERQVVADRYSAGLAGVAVIPKLKPGATSVWAQYTILLDRRDAVAMALKAEGIPTAIYYRIALSQQTGYRHYPSAPGGVPVSEEHSRRVLSLPMHPYLDETTQDRIIAAIRRAA
ncbi:MAG TPA: DegT/DnrJ/EryC1/StrS family aminotransferase [Candidatus Cybelea sp.]|nr:DegT/DnrJ/EryC1/StrS family aminotransferase [Candidatus Cybelea sp.]